MGRRHRSNVVLSEHYFNHENKIRVLIVLFFLLTSFREAPNVKRKDNVMRVSKKEMYHKTYLSGIDTVKIKTGFKVINNDTIHKKNRKILPVLLVNNTALMESFPGGVGANLQLWLKANVGVTATAGNVSAWNDQSGNGNHATQTNGNRQPTLNSSGANFNPRLTFNGTTDFLDIPFNSNINDDNITVFTVHVSNNGTGYRSPITSRTSFPTTGFTLYEQPDDTYSFWTATNGSPPWDLITGSSPSFNRTEIIGFTGTTGSGTATKFLYQNGNLIANTTNQNFTKLTNTAIPTRIGAGSTANPNGEFYWQGDIVEQIIYNRVLSVTERRRVESYLAIKYGITLDVSIANYVNGSGTNIFTYDGTYQTHVLGIGKDNASSLDQRISKSIHSGAILTIATDTNFNNANSSHTDGLTNGQYLIVSSNNGATTLQNTELPSGFSNRIGREWKVTNTGNIGTVHLKFDGFDNTYILLTDTDGDFSSGVTNVGALNANGEIAVTLTNNSYFTLARFNSAPTDITLSNTTVAENTTAVGSLTSTDVDTGQSHSYTLVSGVGDSDNGKFTIVGNTLSFNTAPDFENPTDIGDTGNNNTYTIRVETNDGNGGTYQESLIITVTNIADTFPGGVQTDLQLWLRADEEVTMVPSTGGGGEAEVSVWNDQSGNGNHASSQNLSSTSVMVTANEFNFNPVVTFDDTSDALFGTDLGMNGDNTITEFYVLNGRSNTGDFSNIFIMGNSGVAFANTHRIENTNASNSYGIFDGNFNGGLNAGIVSNSINTHRILAGHHNGTRFAGRNNGLEVSSLNATTGISAQGMYLIGSSEFNFNDGDFAEAIIYNRSLSTSEIQRVESYLALKYGITLDSGITNYVNSLGTVVFAYDGTYEYHVIGIANDHISNLDQRVSKSIHNGAILTLSTDTNFSSPNNTHAQTLDNGQYLIVGSNNANTNVQTTELQSGFLNRIGREWKVGNTGNVETVHLKFEGFNENYILLTDSDGDFSSGVTNSGMLNANGEITVTLTNNIYFTLGMLSNIPPTDIIVSNSIVRENLVAVGTLSTVDSNSEQSHTYTLVSGTGDSDNSKFTITGDTLSFSTAPDFENPTDLGDTPNNNTYSIRVRTDDGNGGIFEKSLIITVMNITAPVVEQSIQLWLKANEGVVTSADNVTQWNDQTGLGNHAVQTATNRQPVFNASGANFNPRVVFNGTSTFMDIPFNEKLNPDHLTVFSVQITNEGNGTLIGSLENSTPSKGYSISAGFSNNYNFSTGTNLVTPLSEVSIVQGVFGEIEMIGATVQPGTSLNKFIYYNGQLGIDVTQRYVKQTDTAIPLRIGGGRPNLTTSSFPNYNGSLLEQIVYDRVLPASERRIVESYLALKYGITLGRETGGYVNAQGQVIYGYDNRYDFFVQGIGKDTGFPLDQRITKSTHSGGILTLSTDTNYTGANTTHTDALTDGQYLIIGNNRFSTTVLRTSELPNSGDFRARIDREWKVSNIGNVGEVHLKFDGFGANYVLLSDNDGDFTNGSTIVGNLDANGEISTTLTHNTYFTLALRLNVAITQVYHSESLGKAIEITNLDDVAIPGELLTLALFNDVTGNPNTSPTAALALPALAAGEVLIITNSDIENVNIINSPTTITNNPITNFSGGNDVLILSLRSDVFAWGSRTDVIRNMNNNTSYVRIDTSTNANTTYMPLEWVVYVNDALDPYRNTSSGGPERHPHAPLLSQVTSSAADRNAGLGYQRRGETIRTGNAWSNGIPDRSRSVVIGENYSHAGGNLLARNLTINNSSKLTITDYPIIVTNQVTLNGANDELRLAGTAQLIQTHTGTERVLGMGKLYVDQNSDVPSIYRFNYMSSPVVTSGEDTYTFASVVKDGSIPTSATSIPQNINIVGGVDGSNTNPISIAEHWIYTYGSEEEWTQKLSSGTISPTDGFIFKGPGVAQNYTFVGTPKDGTLETTVTANTPYLLGNPYASALSGKKFIEDNTNSITGNLYFWEQKESANGETDRSGHNFGGYVGGYAIWNLSMGLAANSPTNTANNNNGIAGLGDGVYKEPKPYIPIGQGFFVSGSTTGGNLVFNNSQREYKIEGSESVFFRGTRNRSSQLPIIKLGMDYTDADNVKLHRQIGVSFLANNSFAFDKNYDAPVFDLGDTDIYWEFENDSNKYAIAGVGKITDDLELPLTIAIDREEEVYIQIDEWEGVDRNVYFIDKSSNTSYLLSEGAKIAITLSKGIYKNRFVLGFGRKTALSIDDVLSAKNLISVAIDQTAKEIMIYNKQNIQISQVKLYDMTGREVQLWQRKELKSDRSRLKYNEKTKGVYMVRLTTIQGVISKFVYIN